MKKARKEKRDALASQFLALKNEIESLIKESNEDGKIHDIKSRTCDRIRSNIESRLIDLRREVDTLQELKYRLAQLEQERGGNVNTQLARASAVLLQQRLVRDQQRKVDEIVDECKAMKQGYDETLADARVLESKMDRRSKEISMKLEQLKLLAGELDKMDAIDPPAAMSLQDQRFP